MIGVFWYIPAGYQLLDSIVFFFLGFMVFGPQMLVGMAAAELAHKRATATASGFAGWFSYVGAAVAGYPLAKISEVYGWEGFFTALLICCFLAFVLLLPTWSAQAKPEKKLEPAVV